MQQIANIADEGNNNRDMVDQAVRTLNADSEPTRHDLGQVFTTVDAKIIRVIPEGIAQHPELRKYERSR